MKKVLMLFVALLLTLNWNVLSAADVSGNNLPTATLQIQTVKDIYRNGDKVELSGENFPLDAEIVAVVLDLYGSKGNADIKILENSDLTVNSDGSLSGYVILQGIEEDHQFGQISIFAKNVITSPTVKFKVYGDLPSNDPPPTEGSSFDFTEESGDNIVQVGEKLTISASSSDWTGVLGSRRYEYKSDTSLIKYVNLGTGNLSVSGGQLTGYIYNKPDSAYHDSTAYMKLWIIDDDLTSAYSTTLYSTIDNISPTITSAIATSLNKIRITLDEAVYQVGDATGRFGFTGTDATGLSVSSMAAVGGDTTTTWDLTLNQNFTNRSVGDVNIYYSQSVADSSNELRDISGNEVAEDTVDVADNIAPASPSLTHPTTTTIMDTGDVKLQATAESAAQDPSIAGVKFQGSSDGSTWTDLGQDTNTGDTAYSYNYTFGTKYAYYRAVAFDTSGATTASSSLGSLTDAHRIEIDTYPSSLNVGVSGYFHIAIQNNYADSVTYQYPVSLTFSLTSSQTTGTFYSDSAATNSITQVNIAGGKRTAYFWYVDTDDNSTPTITVEETGHNLDDYTDSQQITILTVPVDHFHIYTSNNESETAGTAFTVTVIAHNASHDTVTGYVGDHTLNWSDSSNATASPDGTSPQIPADQSYTFTNGVTTISNVVLYNSAETPHLRANDTENNIHTGHYNAGLSITVSDAAAAEARIKTQADTGEEQYAQNVVTDSTFQGPTQASPDKKLILHAVIYDAYGNLISTSDAGGSWSKGASLLGTFSKTSGDSTTLTFDDLNGTGTTYSDTVHYTASTTYGSVTGSTGKIEVDDAAPAQVTIFDITTPFAHQDSIRAFWSTNSYDDGGDTGSGQVSSFDIRWTDEANGYIDTDTEWNSATSVGTSGKPSYYASLWDIDMSSHPAGNKYFAIRTFDDVGNASPLQYTTSPDYTLPVTLTSFTAKADYGKIVLNWETASEIDNEGFFLYRSDDPNGLFVPINSQIIPGAGNSSVAHSYEYVDTNVEEDVTYYYKLYSRDFNGTLHVYGQAVSATVLPLPKKFQIAQNYPNPFNPLTHIRFDVPFNSTVSLEIYNILGQKIKTLVNNRRMEPGVYSGIVWDATDDSGSSVANGVYYLVFTAREFNFQQVRKMVYMK